MTYEYKLQPNTVRLRTKTKEWSEQSTRECHTIKVWSIEKTQLITTLSQHHNWVLALATSQQENLLVSGGTDTTIRLWQFYTE